MNKLLASLSLLIVSSSLVVADHGYGRRHRPHRPAPIDLGRLQAVTNACENAFEGDANENACVQTVLGGRGRFDVTSAIASCESAFDGDANELACLGMYR